ncbi:MAG: FecR family protein [Spirochaetota bacterium]
MRTLLATLLVTTTAFAQEKPKELLAAALSVSGECFYERDGKTLPAKPKTIFFRNDRLFTKKGKMDVQIGPVAVLHLAPYSTIRLSDLSEQDRKTNIVVDLESGRGYTKFAKKMGQGSKYTIKSPTLVAGIRGTEFVLSAGDESPQPHEDSDIPQGVFVNTGVVAVSPASREDEIIELQPGEQVTGVDNALVKGVMEDFIRKKMKLFKQLNAMKEEQYRILEREKNRQIELLEKVKGSVNIEQLKEKNKQLFNK